MTSKKGPYFDFNNGIVHVLLLLLLTQFVPVFDGTFIRLFGQYGKFEKTNRGALEWINSSVTLQAGTYYISASRPKGSCDLLWNDNVLASTKGPDSHVRTDMGLSAYVKTESTSINTVKIVCLPQDGFPSGLSDVPVVMDYLPGRILQSYRLFFSLLFGLLFSIIFLANSFAFSPPLNELLEVRHVQWRKRRLRDRFKNPFLFLSVITVLYSISLSWFFFSWTNSYLATTIHILIRDLFGLAFLRLVMAFSQNKRWISSIYILLFIIDIAVSALYSHSPTFLVRLYEIQCFWYPLSTFYVWYFLNKTQSGSKSIQLLKIITFVWALAQILDAIGNFQRIGFYSGSLFIAILTVGLIKVRREEIEISERMEFVSREVIRILEKRDPPIELIRQILEALKAETEEFPIHSGYVDPYYMGTSTVPHLRLDRIYEYGYEKNTELDSEIFFADSRGLVMMEAIKLGRPILRQGKEGGWYYVIPIGDLGCLNFSNGKPLSRNQVQNSVSILERIAPTLNLLAERMLSNKELKNPFLEKVKIRRGIGEWVIQMGAIFIDVEDSSTRSEESKKLNKDSRDTFYPFLVTNYLPGLMQAICSYSELQSDEGDGLLIVITEDTLPSGQTIETGTCEVVRRIMNFIYGAGADLCREKHFAPITLKGGLCVDMGTLISTEFKVRITGNAILKAARLFAAAPSGSFLVRKDIEHLFNSPEFLKEKDSSLYLVKKDEIFGVPIYHNRFQRRTP